MIFPRTKSDCASCPLRDRKRVWGTGPSNPHLTFIGEAPGYDEDRTGTPFVGAAGHYLNWGLTSAGILRHRCWITNIIACRPPNNNFKSPEAAEALTCCLPGFEQELAFLKESGIRVICKLGGAALDLLSIPDTITKARGSVYLHDSLPVIPTFHPSYLNRMVNAKGPEKPKPIFKYVWVADLKKAKRVSEEGWQPPEENFNLSPTLSELEDYVSFHTSHKSLIAVDIETTGLDPLTHEIVVIGLAHGPTSAISVPLLAQHGVEYWPRSQQTHVRSLLDHLFTSCPLVFQNALFDVPYLQAKNYSIEWKNVAHDTMLLHHAISPELPHSLGFIVSLYGATPYWKENFLSRNGSILDLENDALRTYNLRDCVTLHQVLPGLCADLSETGTSSIYLSESLPLLAPVAAMMKNGIQLDKKKLASYAAKLSRDKAALEKELRAVASLPPAFNLDSDDHLRYFLYGILSNKLKNAEEEIASKKRKDTKVYKKLEGLLEIKTKTKPLAPLPSAYRGRKTDTGKAKVDEQSLLSLQRAYQNRLATINAQKNPKTQEAASIQKLLQWLSAYRRYSELEKLRSTYSHFPAAPDGRVHTSILIHGTATGRLSSASPNLQNIPKENLEIRKCFVAPDGRILVSADYENLEARVLAYETGDEPLINAFEHGLNLHDENTKILFGITPTHPQWKVARRAAKIFAFGNNYGGGDNGIYEKILLACPELGLTFAQFRAVKQRFLDAHPAYHRWAETARKRARETRRVSTFSGRIRILHGLDRDNEKIGLNTPIQGGAASIINLALIRIHSRISPPTKLLLQIHDELLFETVPSFLPRLKTIIKEEMTREVDFYGRKVSFPIKIKTGPSWGELK
jgi:uracil-DNA glycosylase family 4